MNFFDELHLLHILWLIWIFDMLLQIIPIKNKVTLGSQKLFTIIRTKKTKNICVREIRPCIYEKGEKDKAVEYLTVATELSKQER